MYQKPIIYNLELTNLNTEYSQVLPVGTRKVLIRGRNGAAIKLAYVSGQSATNYITIPAGSGGKWLEGIQLSDTTLYMQTADDLGTPEVAEIEVWLNK